MPRNNGALDGHREAVETYLARASALAGSPWQMPAGAGKWSPAQITEHLCLTYEGLTAEMGGGPGIRVRVKGVKLLVVRLVFMPRLLRTGKFPEGIRAPREVTPGDGGPDAAGSLSRLQRATAGFEAAIAPGLGSRRGGITHPFFGRLTPLQGLRFAEVHLRHHTRQLPPQPTA